MAGRPGFIQRPAFGPLSINFNLTIGTVIDHRVAETAKYSANVNVAFTVYHIQRVKSFAADIHLFGGIVSAADGTVQVVGDSPGPHGGLAIYNVTACQDTKFDLLR